MKEYRKSNKHTEPNTTYDRKRVKFSDNTDRNRDHNAMWYVPDLK